MKSWDDRPSSRGEVRERAVRMVFDHERVRLAVGGDPLDRGQVRVFIRAGWPRRWTHRHGRRAVVTRVVADDPLGDVVGADVADPIRGDRYRPSAGVFTANAAWLGLAILAHNLGRWTLAAAGDGFAHATTETLRTKLVSMPARLVHTARRLKLRAPTNWPWRDALQTALTTIAAIPAPT